MKIADWMKTDLVTISRDITLEDAVHLLVEKRVGTLPVVDEKGKILGLVTMKKILMKFLPDFYDIIQNIEYLRDFGALELPSEDLQRLLSKNIADIMEKNPLSVSAECTVLSAIGIMSRHNLSDLLIVEGGILKGLVSTVDLGVAFLHWIKHNAEFSTTLKSECLDNED
jgi:CBS domain-containing protein